MTSSVNATLIAPDNVGVTSFSTGGTSYVAPFTLSQAGTYYLVLSNSAATSQAYHFVMNDSTGVPLTTNATTNGTLATGRSGVLYQFNATAGQSLYFDPISSSPASVAFYSVFAPDNSQRLGYSANNPNDGSRFVAPQTGTYLVWMVGNDPSIPGPISYSFDLNQSTPTTTPLTVGTPVSGTIAQPGSEHDYTFTGTAGQTIWLDGLSSAANIVYELNDPFGGAGSVVGYSSTTTDQGPYTLKFSGTYTVNVVGNNYVNTGAYSFAVRDFASATAANVNAPTSGTLATGLTTDLYKFSATAGQRVDVQGISDANANGAYVYVYGSNFQYITAIYTDPNYNQQFIAPSTGNYYLAVAGQSAANATNAYSFQASVTTTTSTALTLNTVTTGNIPQPGAQANFTFTGTPGQILYFDGQTPGLTGDGSASNIKAVLLDPFGNAVGVNGNDLSFDTNPAFTLTRAGTYTLTVFGQSATQTGSFQFSLDDVSHGAAANINAPTSGTLATGLTTDIYKFSGTAGQSLDLEGISEAHPFDLLLWLYGPNGQYITNIYAQPGYQYQTKLTETGTYYVAVSGQTAAIPNDAYSFQVSVNSIPTTAMSLNAVITGSLPFPGTEHDYTFTGTAGQVLNFDGQTPGLTLDGSASNIVATLTDPLGVAVPNFSTRDLAFDSAPADIVLTRSGTYTLAVRGSGITTGSYQFAIDDFAAAAPLTTNATTSGTLATGITTNLYQFTANAGDALSIQGLNDTPASGAYYYLFDPNQRLIAQNYTNSGSFSETTTTLTGTYVLELVGQDASNASVAYSLRVNDTPLATDALTLNTVTSGSLPLPGALHNYTFNGTAGQTLYFDGLAGNAAIAAILFDPVGSNVGVNTGVAISQGPFTLSRTGAYTLQVSSPNATATGAYSFNLEDTAAAMTLTPGTPVTGTLASGLSTDIYEFTGTAGDVVAVAGQGSTPLNAANAELFGPNGDILNNFTNSGTFGSVTLSISGTYTMYVVGQSAANPNVPYGFELWDTPTPVSALTLNAVTSGTIANPGAAHKYTFTGTPGQELIFNGLGGAAGILATLYDPTGGGVTTTALSSNNGPYILSEAGTYTLTVFGTTLDATGGYSFNLLDATAPANQLTSPANSVTATLSPGTENAVYQFQGQAGQTATITSNTAGLSGDWYLLDPNSNSLGAATLGVTFSRVLPYNGPYTLVLAGTGAAQTYNFNFALSAAASGTPTGLNSPQSGPLAGNASTTYTFTAPAGTTIYLDNRAASGSFIYNLKDQGNNQVFNVDLSTDDSGPYTLTASGTYTLTVTNNSASPTNYAFDVLGVPTTATLADGTVASGTLPGFSATIYAVTIQAGQTLVYNGQTANLSGVTTTFYSPSLGNPLNVNTGSDTNPFTLSQPYGGAAGIGFLVVHNDSAASANFQFRLVNASANPLTTNSLVSGTLTSGLATDASTFNAVAGDRIYVQTLLDSVANGAYYEILGVNGGLYAQGFTDVNNDASFTAPYSGQYTLEVLGQSAANSSVDYKLEVWQSTPPTSVLTLNTPVSGTIPQPGAEHEYTFTGTPGHSIYFDGLNSATGLEVRLQDPNGNIVYLNNSDASLDGAPYYLLSSGTYTLTVSGAAAATARYNFNLLDASSGGADRRDVERRHRRHAHRQPDGALHVHRHHRPADRPSGAD